MSVQEPGSLNEKTHRSIANELAKDELAQIEGSYEQEWPSSKPQEGPWLRQKPARPDVIDIGRTFIVVAVGGMVGVVVVVIVFMLLK